MSVHVVLRFNSLLLLFVFFLSISGIHTTQVQLTKSAMRCRYLLTSARTYLIWTKTSMGMQSQMQQILSTEMRPRNVTFLVLHLARIKFLRLLCYEDRLVCEVHKNPLTGSVTVVSQAGYRDLRLSELQEPDARFIIYTVRCLTFWPPPSWTHPPAGRTSLRVPASA